jgi:hypothetical protein
MIFPRSTRHVWLLVALLLGFLACSKDGPDKSSPFIVVLDEAPTRSLAEKRAANYSKKYPKQLEEAGVVSIAQEGIARHLVTSPGFDTRAAAKKLADDLSQANQVRLRVVDLTGLRLAEDDQYFGSGVPDGLEVLEKLAALLPTGQAGQLESFQLLPKLQAGCKVPLDFGRNAPMKWAQSFCRLGFSASAEAVYHAQGAPADSRVQVFVGLFAKGQDPAEALKKAYNFLLDHQAPTEEEWEKIKEEKKASRKKKRKRSKRRKRRRRRKATPEVVELQPVKELLDPPKPQERMLPWGKTGVISFERLTMIPRDKYREETPARSAWLGLLPGQQGIFIVFFDDQAEAEKLLHKDSLGEPHGIQYSPQFLGAWQILPEVHIAEEEMSFLAMQPFGRQLNKAMRKSAWGKKHSGRPVTKAGYRSAKANWMVSWVDLGHVADAKKVFDKAYIAPRQQLLQNILKSKRKIRYEYGISLMEVGDVQGWYLRGANHGRTQELYFSYQAWVFLVQAPQSQKSSFGPDDLQARMELLQVWDQNPEK